MPDVSKIRLPGNAEVNIKDARISGVDNTPTSGSGNVVTSGGVYAALQALLAQMISFDDVSTNQDGTLIITLSNGDTITVDLNHTHEGLLPEVSSSDNGKIVKVVSGEWELATEAGGNSNIVHLEDESDMPASPDPDTLYAIDDDGELLVSTSAQTLTSAQQSQARTNIGAAATSDIPTTVASMTDASNYPKYVLLADEAAYTALATKDSGTLYLIPKTS